MNTLEELSGISRRYMDGSSDTIVIKLDDCTDEEIKEADFKVVVVKNYQCIKLEWFKNYKKAKKKFDYYNKQYLS